MASHLIRIACNNTLRGVRTTATSRTPVNRLFSTTTTNNNKFTHSSSDRHIRPSSCTFTLTRSMTPVRRFASDANGTPTATPTNEQSTTTADAATTATAPPTVDPKIAELTAELKKKEALLKECQEKYTYALAEAQNTLTRSQKQIADAKQFAVQSFAKSLLEVADVLEIATKAAEPHAAETADPNFKNLFEGISMTKNVLFQVFERSGLKKFEPLGEKFDPYFQEGLLQMEDATKTPGTVGVVLKSGYKLHDRCLRAAQVGTIKAPSKQ